MLVIVRDVNNAIKFHFSQYSKADISVAYISSKISIFDFRIFCLFKLPVFAQSNKCVENINNVPDPKTSADMWKTSNGYKCF